MIRVDVNEYCFHLYICTYMFHFYICFKCFLSFYQLTLLTLLLYDSALLDRFNLNKDKTSQDLTSFSFILINRQELINITIEQKQLLKIMFKTKLTNESLTNYSRPNITWKPLSVYKRFKYHKWTTIPNIDKVFINPNLVSFG